MKRLLQRNKGLILFLISLFVYGVFLSVSPLKTGGDSGFYTRLATEIAGGDFQSLREWPLHWLYSGCLSVGYIIIPHHFLIFVRVFNIFVISLIPLLFYKISNLVTELDKASFVISLPIIFYPNFNFWSRYILTDIFFLAVLLLHVFAILRFLKEQGVRTLLGLILSFLALLFSRPNSLPALLISAGFIFFCQWGKKAMILFTLAIVLCTTLVLVIPSSRAKILSLPTVYQSLWLSTRISSTTASEQVKRAKFQEEIPTGMSEVEFKLNYFKDFIIHRPAEYVKMCLKRFVAYWYPWIWGEWSIYHKILDGLISLLLTVIALCALLNKKMSNYKYYFLALALGFSLLSVFGQIDSDGRYRLPGELSLLLLIAPTIIPFWRANRGSSGGRLSLTAKGEIPPDD